MRKIALTISYDGTRYIGWQRQREAETVQGELERAISLLHKTDIEVVGSGRTDSGVHAVGQVAHFMSPIDSIPIQNYADAINCFLPSDIRIVKAEEKDEDFHSRYSAVNRTYRYFFHCGASSPFAHTMDYVWWLRYKPNLENLNNMASCLIGEIDCTSFTALGDKSVSPYRLIEKAHFFYEENKLIFEICANAFLWKMVRTLVGTFIDLDMKGLGTSDFQEIIDAKNRKKASATAPAKGLFLWHIEFDGKRAHP